MLRDYQSKLAVECYELLRKWHIAYLSIEMRVGKTTIALESARLYGAKNVIFITPKKAIQSIIGDYEREGFPFKLKVTNYEQAKNEKPVYDFVIIDEAHKLGAYPKPAARTKAIKDLVGRNPIVFCSGTPTPETETQLFHQFWVSHYNPFGEESFYKWAKMYVNVKEVVRNGIRFNDYKSAKRDDIMRVVKKYFISYTREEAGFEMSEPIEKVISVSIDPNIERLVKVLLRDKYFKFKDGTEVVCDSAVKLQSKIHQIYSGTVKTECGKQKILDYSKAIFIREKYIGEKLAIFYKFVSEGDALKEILINWTDDPEVFKANSDKCFICQVSSGSMGVDLSSADYLLFYNIDFSSVQYWQARSRLQTLSRTKPAIVHWIFSERGIERKIYKTVLQKKDYTLFYFSKDFINEGIKNSIQNNRPLGAIGSLRSQNHCIKS